LLKNLSFYHLSPGFLNLEKILTSVFVQFQEDCVLYKSEFLTGFETKRGFVQVVISEH